MDTAALLAAFLPEGAYDERLYVGPYDEKDKTLQITVYFRSEHDHQKYRVDLEFDLKNFGVVLANEAVPF